MADDADHAIVDQFLRNGSGDFRIGLVVLAHQVDVHFLAAQDEASGVDFIHRQTRAVFVILAQMRLRAGQWRHRTNLDVAMFRCAVTFAAAHQAIAWP